MRIQVDAGTLRDAGKASALEWLETNGTGGYASSSVIGANTRRYHGLLVPALDPPVRRTVLLSRVEETVETSGRPIELGCNFYPGAIHPQGHTLQTGFRLDPFPLFTWQAGDRRIEKAVFLVHGQDTVVLRYSLLAGAPCTLRLRPFLAFRDYHALVREDPSIDARVEVRPGRVTVRPRPSMPALHFHHPGEGATVSSGWWKNHQYPRERERGLDFEEDLWSPFEIACELSPRGPLIVVASLAGTLPVEPLRLEASERARRAGVVAAVSRAAPALDETLALASDAFLVRGRGGAPTVIAGYHWFTDWGRDTMISLPGLCLATGRKDLARDVLLAFAKHLDRGMIPNRFPDSGEPPEYNNADGTLWFVHAIGLWAKAGGDPALAASAFLPAIEEILARHREGTRYGIRVDSDGLLAAGEPGVQLTWMDAKVDDWVVTPRIGKPVEINALWIEALDVAAWMSAAAGKPDAAFRELQFRARQAFNRRFWNAASGCLFDVVDGPDGDDASIRPNQLFAISLPSAALDADKAASVMEVVRRELLTPFGLRTLSPKDERFAPRCAGDRRARDGAYHQGTVWPWLLGPFVRAWLKTFGRSPRTVEEARGFVKPLLGHLADAGLGQVSEIFDGSAPHAPAGCIAQAWSVAELIRVLAEDLA